MKSFLLAVVALAACGGDSADQGVADGEVAEVEVTEEVAVEVVDVDIRDGLDGTEAEVETTTEVELVEPEVAEETSEVVEEIAAEVIEVSEVGEETVEEVIEDVEVVDEVIDVGPEVDDVEMIEDTIEVDDGDTFTPEVPEPEVIEEVAQEVEVVLPPQIDVTPGCNTVFSEVPVQAAPHIPLCSATAYTTNPPTSGPHYPTWAAFKTYTNPVNLGFLVHSQEHGAVVIHHRCGDTPCDAELAQLATFIAGRAADQMCVAPVTNRIIVTPSVSIPSRFAVSAWGGMITSDCFDFEALADFIDYYYAKGPENFCSPGADLDTIEAGSALYCPPI